MNENHDDNLDPISIPQVEDQAYYDGTTGVPCRCGGTIEWAEGGYSPGSRACRSCLALYAVQGTGSDRRLVLQTDGGRGVLRDVDPGVDRIDDVYRVSANLYPSWHQPLRRRPSAAAHAAR